MNYDVYLDVIKKLNETYGTTVEVEHQFIHEFFEGPHAIFKLILNDTPEHPGILLVSFHLDLPSPAAIQWFLRIRQLDPTLFMTGCYLKDAQGNSHVGDDADILKMYMLEQEVISAWIQSNKDEEEALKAPQLVPPTPKPVFNTVKAALVEFDRMNKKKDDTFH